MAKTSYVNAILQGFEYVMSSDPKCFAIGQGLWSPWYVGGSMDGLENRFGKDRVIDTPVSEQATTGMAVGAALCGYKPIVIHPRIDFMILATDQIVNQAAKWRHMLGGQTSPSIVIRGIVNRGGEQGAQHSQALHSWFAHIPGLRVVMPATPSDARDLLIGAVQSPDPVLYIDDRWLYDWEEELADAVPVDLTKIKPVTRRLGKDITIAAASYSVRLALLAADKLAARGIECEVIDIRALNPIDMTPVQASVRRTGRFLAIDGGWRTCGFAGEMIASVCEAVEPGQLRAAPARMTLPDAPAPTSKVLEAIYYASVADVEHKIMKMLGRSDSSSA
jgi:acetoin:2,6-dichlorophenolindophenol oxidoreductase subunit beta